MEKVILIGIFTEYKKMDAINLPILFAFYLLNKTTKIYHVYSHITFMTSLRIYNYTSHTEEQM